MKFKNIEAFLAVAENLSFSKAAAQLGCSQATVTVQIKELENELGAILFDRMNKSVKLTSAGNVFLPYAQKIIFDTNSMLSQFGAKDTVEGSVRIAVWQTLNLLVLPDILDRFCRRYPNVNITLWSPSPESCTSCLPKMRRISHIW